jgi:hypothetical protein
VWGGFVSKKKDCRRDGGSTTPPRSCRTTAPRAQACPRPRPAPRRLPVPFVCVCVCVCVCCACVCVCARVCVWGGTAGGGGWCRTSRRLRGPGTCRPRRAGLDGHLTHPTGRGPAAPAPRDKSACWMARGVQRGRGRGAHQSHSTHAVPSILQAPGRARRATRAASFSAAAAARSARSSRETPPPGGGGEKS